MVVVFVVSGFVTIMDGTIINVALPTIGRDFRVSPTAVGVIATAYIVAMGVAVPISGWLAGRFGAKRVMLTALLAFTLASALCGVAINLTELAVFRVVQGLAGGMLAPVGLAMLYSTIPPGERLRVATFAMIPTLLAPATGPVLGGFLVTEISWRFVFFVNVPIGLAAVIFGGRSVAEVELNGQAPRLDLPGFVLSTLGVGTLMFGLSEGPVLGWGSPAVLVTSAGGALLLACTVVAELRRQRPLLDFRLFADRAFRTGTGVTASTGAAFIGTLFAVSLYFQYGRGLSPLMSGLSTFPEAVGVLCGGQLASRVLHRRFGPRRLITLGALGATVTIALLATMDARTSLWWARAILFCLGLSIGQILVQTQVSAFSGIESGTTNTASTLFTVVRQLSGSVGIALLTTVVGIVGATQRINGRATANLDAYRWPFVVAAALALLGVLCARRISAVEPDA